MKRLIYVLLLFVAVTACNEDYLNVEPKDRISSQGVFKDKALTSANLNFLEGKLPYGIHGSVGYGYYGMFASQTDEARPKSGWVGPAHVVKGNLTPTNSRGIGLWGPAYQDIRVANTIIEGVTGSEFDEEYKSDVIARARYVRAFKYYELARRYGDVPLITVAQQMDDDLLVGQTPRAQVYDFISTELSEIAQVLPNRSDVEPGSINKQAAIAINARVNIYAQNWAEAAQLADQLITGSANDGIDLHPNYRELFLSYGGNNETIMEKLTMPPIVGTSFGYINWPVRWRTGWGGQTDPTQEMVDSYAMADGSEFDWNNPEHAANPYANREPRFYESIFYHGKEFSAVQPSSGEPYIDMEWDNFNEGPGAKKHGAASITGYLVYKFVDPAEGFATPAGNGRISWQEIRFAEVLLIYAEAANEVEGATAKVYDAVNRIRARADLPALPVGLSKDEMREKIRHERKIELAFENHRWFDLIRWGIAEEVLDGFAGHGIKVERKPEAPSKEEQPQLFDPELLTYTVFEVAGRVQTFPAAYNLMPIPQSELDKNPNLTQNPGY